MTTKKNVLDSLLETLTKGQQKSNAGLDKIPSAHSDLIISMILSKSSELFVDNRKRKPAYNARRKAKWSELVEELNKDLGVDYSVERVKNNYHYRVTSLKRAITRISSELKDEEDIKDLPAFQQLSEMDKQLYDAVKFNCAEIIEPTIKRKKGNLPP
jgi:hypothetical protein